MLNYIYRLKKKKGMVLFFVVMVMALLIIMSTAAYYTARNSYNTVLSNYDFEQMYLSAISISDIIVGTMNGQNDAMITDSNGDGSGAPINQLDVLKEGAIQYLKIDTFKASFAGKAYDSRPANVTGLGDDHAITIRTSGAFATAADATGTHAALATEANKNPVKEGILDGAVIEIKLTKAVREADGEGTPVPEGTDKVKVTDKFTCYYTVKTTAFYRDNYIIIEDVVTEEGVEVTSIWNNIDTSTPGDPGSEGTDPEYEWRWVPKNTNGTPSNTTFFTATGQTVNNGGNYDIDSRSVVIKTHEISDNAYFENDYTFLVSGNNIDFYGGIRASGTVYLDQLNAHIPAPDANKRHDWIINGDLILDGNAKGLNLNGNNLYVGGNIIILNAAEITAADVYCQGTVYNFASGQASVTGNLHAGNITDTPDANFYDTAAKVKAAYSSTMNTNLNSQGLNNPSKPNALNVSGTTDLLKGGTITGTSSLPSDSGNGWKLTDDVTVVKYEKTDDEGKPTGQYTDKTTVESMLQSSKSGGNWDSGSAKPTTLENNLTIDIQNDNGLQKLATPSYTSYKDSKNQNRQKKTYNYTTADGTKVTAVVWDQNDEAHKGQIDFTYTSSNAAEGAQPASATYNTTGNGTLSVDIPYTTDGYALTLNYGKHKETVEEWWPVHQIVEKDVYTGSNSAIDINIGTSKDKTMPVVLKANFNDGKGGDEDTNGNNAFSWKANNYTNDGYGAFIKLVDTNDDGTLNKTQTANGNVAFLMGDYDRATGEYVLYDKSKWSGIETTTYYSAQQSLIGTLDQFNHIMESSSSKTKYSVQETGPFKSMLGDYSIPNMDGYQDRVIISSNKVGGVAIDGAQKENTLCGYIYAPNGRYETWDVAGAGVPVFGGMIVSNYTADLAYWQYAEPDSSIISSMLQGLGVGSFGTDGEWKKFKISDGTPATDPTEPGPSSSNHGLDKIDSAGSGTIDDTNGGKNYLG